MKVELTFDLTDDKDYTLWAKIAAALSGSMSPDVPAAPRAKLQPQATATATAPAAPPQPISQPAAPPPPAVQPPPVAPSTPPQTPTAPAQGNGAGATVQDLREALGALGAVTSPGEAADFLRLQLGSPNLSSIPENQRDAALAKLKQEKANREAMA